MLHTHGYTLRLGSQDPFSPSLAGRASSALSTFESSQCRDELLVDDILQRLKAGTTLWNGSKEVGP